MDAVQRKRAARRAARALLDVAGAQGTDLQRLEQELGTFVELMRAHSSFGKALTSPRVPATYKANIARQIATRLELSPVVSKALLLFADRHWFSLLGDVLTEVRRQRPEREGVVSGRVTTAVPLSESAQRTIAERLSTVTGRKVRLDSVVVDPSILGGVIATVGNVVYDGSIAGQLERLKRHLLSAGMADSRPDPAPARL